MKEMKEMKKISIEESIENFSKIISNFLDNEFLTLDNYYPEYCSLVTDLKRNFWQLKKIVLDDNMLEENLNFMKIQVKKKEEEYAQDFRNTKLTFEKYHFVDILNLLERKKQNEAVLFRKIYIKFFTTLYDEISDYFEEKRDAHKMALFCEKMRNERI